MGVPTYGGQAVFGLVTSCVATLNQVATQKEEFAGVNGRLSKFLGTRGTTVRVRGLLNDSDLASLNADEQILLSFADGVARQLVDVRGRPFNNMLFEGDYDPDPRGPVRLAGGGWGLEYTMTFVGLTP
jgi:hypothetical protein